MRRTRPSADMSSLAQLIIFLFVLIGISITVYVLVIRFFYWGSNKPPDKKD